MASAARTVRQHARWAQVLALVVVILALVTTVNIVAHRRSAGHTYIESQLRNLDLLLHEESNLQWKTLADRSAPVRVAREVGITRSRERAILATLRAALSSTAYASLQQRADKYHEVLDRELALLVTIHIEAAQALESGQADPAFASLSKEIGGLELEQASMARAAARTADLTLVVAMVFTALVIGALLRRFEHAHRVAARASADLLHQEQVALAQSERSAAMIRRQAEHDALTDLPNRVLFADRVQQALSRGGDHAVLFVDLDDFKRVNDGLGHAAGDELLVAVAGRLQAAARAQDVSARFGGDEFAVLVQEGGVEAATGVAQRLLAVLQEPVAVGGIQILVHASVGIALTGPDGDVDALLRNADVAMYEAKLRGKGQVVVFDPSMHERISHRVGLENELREALETDQLFLAYQPMVALADGAVLGAEALVRWDHPTEGLMSPAKFLPVAEQSGLIVPLGRWVLREACHQVSRWRSAGVVDGGFVVSVNFSPNELRNPQILDEIMAALDDSGLDAAALVVEITESAILENQETVGIVLETLRSRGVRIALDDFGTGFSSLSHLQRFAVDQIKIDMSFVAAADEIGTAILRLGQTMGLETVAEGIETTEQAERWRALGCDLAQGYLFSPPLRAADFAERFAVATGPPAVVSPVGLAAR
jgi:diguanylate cyclase (GGDEF)-like protein